MEVRRHNRSAEEDPNASDRIAFIFYTDEGGYRATNEVDGEMQVVYYSVSSTSLRRIIY